MAQYQPTSSAYYFPTASTALGAIAKTQADLLQVALDYSQWLDTGETVTGMAYNLSPGTVPPLIASNSVIGPNAGSPVVLGALVTLLLQQGQPGVNYNLNIKATTSAGRTKTDLLVVQVGKNGGGGGGGGGGEWGPCVGSPPGYPALPGGYAPGFVPTPVQPALPPQQSANLFNGQGTQFGSSYVAYTVSNQAPSPANVLDFWFNTVDGQIYQYVTDGTSAFWLNNTVIAQAPAQCVSAASDPGVSNFRIGDMWWNTATSKLNIAINNGTASPVWLIVN